MKLSLLLPSVLGASAASMSNGDISASSDLGRTLLSSARRLDDNNNGDDDGYSHAWIESYSLKFQGCHHIAQWNDDADDNGGDGMYDVKIKTKRLVRFRLCPTDSCSSSSAYGCRKGYGDYVVDLGVYAKAYFESKRRATEQACEMYLWKNCDCDDNDDRGDDFNAEYCEYDCFVAAGKEECVDRNPYNGDEEEGGRDEDADRYLECEELELNDDGDGRKLEDRGAGYYVGPYCAEGGSKVLLGLFTDDTCTQFADDEGGRDTYTSLTGGESLPYSSSSLVGMDCLSCQEGEDVNEMKERQEFYDQYGYYESNGDENEDDEDRIADQCEELYDVAGKCEVNLESGVTDNPVNNACKYIEGIRITRQNDAGVIVGEKRGNGAMIGSIVFFSLTFAALGAYVVYLRKRLGFRINLDS